MVTAEAEPFGSLDFITSLDPRFHRQSIRASYCFGSKGQRADVRTARDRGFAEDLGQLLGTAQAKIKAGLASARRSRNSATVECGRLLSGDGTWLLDSGAAGGAMVVAAGAAAPRSAGYRKARKAFPTPKRRWAAVRAKTAKITDR